VPLKAEYVAGGVSPSAASGVRLRTVCTNSHEFNVTVFIHSSLFAQKLQRQSYNSSEMVCHEELIWFF